MASTIREVVTESMTRESGMIRLVHITTVPESLSFVEGGRVGYLKARGFEFHAISSPGERLDRFGAREEVPVYAVEMPRRITPLHDLVAVFQLWRCLRQIRPHIVQAGTPKGGLLGMIGAWLAGVPVRIYHVYGLPFVAATGYKRTILLWSEKISCLLAHEVICISHSNRELVMEEGLCKASKVTLLKHGSLNGVDATGKYNPDVVEQYARRSARSEFGIPDDALVVGFVGRNVRDKGLIELIGAWNTLREEFPTLHLLVVGTPEPQDPLPPEVEQIMHSDPRIHATGFISEIPMPLVFAAMDVLALPSYREGFPVTPMEAAAMEVPVVATYVSGNVDAVEDGATGTLVPPRNAAALAGAIRKYLNAPELRRSHGRAGRQRMLRDFRPEPIWEAQYQEYERLLQKKGLPIPRPVLGSTEAASCS